MVGRGEESDSGRNLAKPSSLLHQLVYRTMSKPKFQTEWEEIDQEYQQLQVNNSAKSERSFTGVCWLLLVSADRRYSCRLVWIAPSFPSFILIPGIKSSPRHFCLQEQHLRVKHNLQSSVPPCYCSKSC